MIAQRGDRTVRAFKPSTIPSCIIKATLQYHSYGKENKLLNPIPGLTKRYIGSVLQIFFMASIY